MHYNIRLVTGNTTLSRHEFEPTFALIRLYRGIDRSFLKKFILMTLYMYLNIEYISDTL